MPGSEEHLRQAARFEAFLQQIDTPTQPYREWCVIVRFHIALHYVDAFLAERGHLQTDNHGDRFTRIALLPETRGPIETAFRRLYKDAKEARYEGGDFTPHDLLSVDARYQRVRRAMRQALGLPPQ